MRVETAYDGRAAVVRLDGRLDAECAVQLAAALEEALHGGARTAVVDMSGVQYASSAGVAAITRSAREFAAVRGELFVTAPPAAVRLALTAAGLGDRILQTPDVERGRISSALDIRGREGQQTREWHATATPAATAGQYEAVPRVAGATLSCRVLGKPGLRAAALQADDCHEVRFGEQTFGLGVGALGDSFDRCGDRFGELLGAGGVVVYLPTAGGGVPDYLGSLGGSPPTAMVRSALICEGDASHLVRFSSSTSAPVPLAELAEVCLDTTGGDAAGIVVVAETAGLVGAWRRAASGQLRGAFGFEPAALREWLTLTSEPSYEGTTTLVVGVIARHAEPPLVAHLRPLRATPGLLGHLHAAVFPYRPVPQRTISVRTIVAELLEESGVRAVLHLLDDHRETGGAGQSTFLRGLAWTAPIGRVEEGSP
jgi:anti-anti-sigma factor